MNNILLIEDDPDDTLLIQETFSQRREAPEYEIVCENRLASGLKRLSEEGIDLVLLDLSLPDSTGFDTFLQVKNQFPNMPIILLTGLDDEDLAARAVHEGAQDYLVKSHLTHHLLRRAIRYAMERTRADEALRRSEEQLLQAQKMEAVGRLAGGVAHDFNNMLSVILGFSDLALKKLDPADTLHRYLVEIRKAGQRAASLTQRLLTFSRAKMMQPRVIDLNAVVADMEKMLRRLIGEDIELVTSLAPQLRRVRADPAQIEQALVNLSINARDAMPRGGRMAIETSNMTLSEEDARRSLNLRSGDFVSLSVTDTGVGLTNDVKAHLFEPFFTTKGPGKGTGLGLSIVYGIAKQSGGDVRVESEPDKGATFRILLPSVEPRSEESRFPPAQSQSLSGHETILLVEDEEAVRQLVLEICEKAGYKVLESPDGPHAIDLCAKHAGPIDLVVTDMVMPQMSGQELATRLREKCPNLKVLFISGYTDSEVFDSKEDLGKAPFLQKPFSPDAFMVKVREVLDNPSH